MGGSASTCAPALPPIPDHELLSLIGHGSYGEVWLARNVMGTLRAVKIVRRHTFDEDKPFERELAGIRKYEPVSRSHEGLVQVLHVGRNDLAGCFYYVMELADDAIGQRAEDRSPRSKVRSQPSVSGTGPPSPHLRPPSSDAYRPKTLRSEISRRGRIPFDELLPLSLSLTTALGHLHRQGLTHRDLKPSNIIFVQGRPKIADLGLVSGLDESHSFVGTEGFIPPEGPGTAMADLYSLGKVLYEASTGKDRLSFPEIPDEWLGPPPQQGPLEFHEVVLKACEGRVDKRYRRAEEVHADLALLQSGKSVRHLHLMERRVAFLTRAGLVAGVAAVLALAGYLFAVREARIEHRHLEQMARAEQQARKAEWAARQAERQTQAALHESLLMQARAGRRSGLSGCRFDSLEALRRAATATNSLALRNEAIGCLALADLRIITNTPLERKDGHFFAFDRRVEHALFRDRSGGYHFCRLSDGQETLVFRPADTNVQPRLPDATGAPRLAPNFLDDVRRFWALSHTVGSTWRTSNAPPHDRLQISPDGSCLAVVTPRRMIEVYEMTNGTRLRSLEGEVHRSPLSFSPDGRRLAVSLREKNAVCVLDWMNGARQATLPHPEGLVHLAWSGDGRTLGTTCFDRKIRLWDTDTGQLRQSLAGHQSQVSFLDFHPSAAVLASASWDGTTRLWDAATGRLLVTLLTCGPELRFSPDGRRLAFPTFPENQIATCEVTTDRICRFLREMPPFAGEVPDNGPWDVEFSPDERLLAAATFDGVRLWDVARAEEVGRLKLGSCRTAVFRPQGEELVVCGSSSGVQAWAVRADFEAGEVAVGPPRVLSAGLRDYGRACLSREGQVLAFDHGSELSVRREDGTVFRVPADGVDRTHAALSIDGRWLATSLFGSGEVILWSVVSGQSVWTNLVEHGARLTFSPNGRWLAANSGEEICIYDPPTGQPGPRIRRPLSGDLAGPVAFSPDGRVLAAAITRTVVQLFDAHTGLALGALESPTPRLASWITFSPSGTNLAIATEAHVIELWDLRMLRQQLAELGLDWDQPPYPPAPTNAPAGPIRIRIQR